MQEELRQRLQLPEAVVEPWRQHIADVVSRYLGAEDELKTKEATPHTATMAAQQQIMKVQQDMQDPAQMEQLISMQMEKLMAEVLPGLLPTGEDPMADPLVQIRMQELALKEKDLQRKVEDDQGDMLMELQKMQQRAATDAARIESQEDIAQNRNEVNRERIDVQRQAAQRRG